MNPEFDEVVAHRDWLQRENRELRALLARVADELADEGMPGWAREVRSASEDIGK